MAAQTVFDKTLLDRRRLRALASGSLGRTSFLLDTVAEELAERLSIVDRRFTLGFDIASHTGALARRLREGGQVERLVRMERDPRLLGETEDALVGDEELLPLKPVSADLIVSALAYHLTNDTPGAFVQARRALRPDGLFFIAILGGSTLNELRTALLHAEAEVLGGGSPRVAPFIDIRDAGALLQRAGLALPVADQDRLTVRYASMFELMRDLRGMGMANTLLARRRAPDPRRLFLRAAEIYAERFSDADGRVRATFDVIYLSGWAPHESQQKPLKPGSATASLADALKPRDG